MNKPTANRKDRAWEFRERNRKVWYKVGCPLYEKACKYCGSYDVFRVYKPHVLGIRHYCYTCSAKDEECW
jgi:hypothetical protein